MALSSAGAQSTVTSPGDEPPPVMREFRGAWVASVANIDWPSAPGLSSAQQQAELLAIMDRAVALRLNALILQVRPAADALYESKLEPWSEFLTGQMGQPPEPRYDPLAFAVREAHARGLQLHAWFNPFRARDPSMMSPVSRRHVSRAHPGLVVRYGNYLWLDPGSAAARAHSLRVILDVVRRYDIDGVHIDDYFYPYKVRAPRGGELDFPDGVTWRRYRRSGGRLDRAAWRRRNVDHFVRDLHRAIRRAKPRLQFGISPFGIWRPGFPAGITGLDAFDELNADSRRWLREGWLDYIVPQLYWPLRQEAQSYPRLLEWWSEQNVRGRHLWAGNFTSRVAGTEPSQMWPAGELLEQIRLTRAQRGAGGNVHFSMRALMDNRDGLSDSLMADLYREPALPPATPWLDAVAPARPKARVRTGPDGRPVLELSRGGREVPWLWVVRERVAGDWITSIIPGDRATHLVAPGDSLSAGGEVLVNAVDRLGNLSPPAQLRPASGH